MRAIRGSFCKTLEEQIVVLRPVPQVLQDDTETDEWVFCGCPYPRKAFQLIIGENVEQKIIIIKRGLTVDPDGISVSEAEYRGNVTPPLKTIQVGDLVLRVQKRCQELYIYGITDVAGIQQLELENRSKTGDAGI